MDKQHIFIFGAGQAGLDFYRLWHDRFHIIGFIDNNTDKQGQVLAGIPIYAPGQIQALTYQKIIIASDYYREIDQQLREQLHISPELIDFSFHFQKPRSIWRTLWCSHPWLSRQRALLACWLARWQPTFSTQGLIPYRIYWLDKLNNARIHLFRSAYQANAWAPHYVGRRRQKKTKTIIPAVSLYRFHQAQISAVTRAICLPNHEIVIERVPTVNDIRVNYAGHYIAHHDQKTAWLHPKTPVLLKKGIALTGHNETNYYHWCLEVLSQFQFLKELPDRYQDYPLLISSYAQKIPSIMQWLQALDSQRHIIWLQQGKTYQIEDLLWINMPNNFTADLKYSAACTAKHCFVRAESISFLRETGLKIASQEKALTTSKRIFLARKLILRPYNQDQVLTLLQAYGFEAVYLEDLSVGQQVKYMQQAEIIIGPTGAAWTNLIFASKGARALCWMAKACGDLSCFAQIAKVIGVNLNYLTYPTQSETMQSLRYQPYQVDIKAIASWLQQNIGPCPGQNTYEYSTAEITRSSR